GGEAERRRPAEAFALHPAFGRHTSFARRTAFALRQDGRGADPARRRRYANDHDDERRARKARGGISVVSGFSRTVGTIVLWGNPALQLPAIQQSNYPITRLPDYPIHSDR